MLLLLKIQLENYVDFEKSIEKLKKFCELKEVEVNKFMEEAVVLIGLDDQHIGDLKDCSISSTNLYQVMYKMVTQYDNKKDHLWGVHKRDDVEVILFGDKLERLKAQRGPVDQNCVIYNDIDDEEDFNLFKQKRI